MSEEMVTITRKQYDSLLDDEKWRICVENAGVDNWEGFYYAMQEYYSEVGLDADDD